jgi:hypothetical protein
MRSAEPPDKERRAAERRRPNYTPAETRELRITRVHFRDSMMFCLLSDGTMVCVPLTISPRLAVARADMRYKWSIVDDGRAMCGGRERLVEQLTAEEIVSHPEAQISELPEP